MWRAAVALEQSPLAVAFVGFVWQVSTFISMPP